MSNTNEIKAVVEAINNKTAILHKTEVVTVDDLKAIADRSFKDILDNNPELLTPFKNYVIYYKLDENGEYTEKGQLYPFSSEEVVAAGVPVTDDIGLDVEWISVGKGKGYKKMDYNDPIAMAAYANPKLRATLTPVVKLKSVGKKNHDGTISSVGSDEAIVPVKIAASKWRGFKSRSMRKGDSAAEKQLLILNAKLKKAEKAKATEVVKGLKKMISIIEKEIKVNKK